MDWDLTEVRDYPLTVLVTDLRNSSQILNRCPKDIALDFFEAFAGLTFEALDTVILDPEDWRINNFLGDGFLIFIADPDEHARAKQGPAQAVRAAMLMRQKLQQLCALPDFREHGFAEIRLAAGIAYGTVHYGHFTGPTYSRNTGVSPEVTRAFRLVQHAREHLTLVSPEAFRQIHSGEFRMVPYTLPDVRGFGPVECFAVVDNAESRSPVD